MSNNKDLTIVALHDYFAAQVLPAVWGKQYVDWGQEGKSFSEDEIARDAYRMADAMLKARSNSEGLTLVRKLEHSIELVKTYRGMVTLKVNGETVLLHEGETLQLKTGDPVVEV